MSRDEDFDADVTAAAERLRCQGDREPISYSEAVSFATESLRRCAEPRGVCDVFTIKGAERSQAAVLGLRALEADAEGFLERARHDPTLFRQAQFALAIKDERGVTLTPAERRWKLESDFDAMPRPKGRKPGPRPKPEGRPPHALEIFIVMTIADLKKRGKLPTRNDATDDKTSGCDAVAKAMFALGLHPNSYDGVKDLWEARHGMMTVVAGDGDWWG